MFCSVRVATVFRTWRALMAGLKWWPAISNSSLIVLDTKPPWLCPDTVSESLPYFSITFSVWDVASRMRFVFSADLGLNAILEFTRQSFRNSRVRLMSSVVPRKLMCVSPVIGLCKTRLSSVLSSSSTSKPFRSSMYPYRDFRH